MIEKEELYRWGKFLKELEEFSLGESSREKRLSILNQFRPETVLLSFWLNNILIAGGASSQTDIIPNECDLCSRALTQGLCIDGQIEDGRWSYMCMECFTQFGVGLGWGVGQLYRLIDPEKSIWLCIAGGEPAITPA